MIIYANVDTVVAVPTSGLTFGNGIAMSWLANVDCTGAEAQLTDCVNGAPGLDEDCSGSHGIAGVICRQSK